MLYDDSGEAGSNEKEAKKDLADPLKEAGESMQTYFKNAFNPLEIIKSFASIFGQLEGLASSFNKAMGGGAAYSDQIKQNLIGGKMAAEEYGFSIRDVSDLQKEITKTEQTNFNGFQYIVNYAN